MGGGHGLGVGSVGLNGPSGPAPSSRGAAPSSRYQSSPHGSAGAPPPPPGGASPDNRRKSMDGPPGDVGGAYDRRYQGDRQEREFGAGEAFGKVNEAWSLLEGFA